MPTDPAAPFTSDPALALAERLSQLERRLAAVETREGIPVVTSLPAFGRKGRLVFLTTDSKVYKDTGSAWVNPL